MMISSRLAPHNLCSTHITNGESSRSNVLTPFSRSKEMVSHVHYCHLGGGLS